MSQKLALIIGNSEYQDTNLARLVTPGEDASDLAKVLGNPQIGGFDEVTALVNEPVNVIRPAIARFFDKKKRDDLLLLYFSGHGVRDDRGNLYLAVNDTERDLLSGTAIPAAFITDEMDRSRSQRQVLILDCCHSGAFARGTKGALGSSVSTAAAFEGTGYGRVVLTATDSTQYAWEGDQVLGEAENSVFTHYLIQGLRTGEADADADGWITLDELYDYVYERVVNETPRQTPGKWAYKQQGGIVIAHNPRLVVKPAELPTGLQQAIVSPFAGVRAGAMHELDRLLRGSDKALALAAYAALERLADDGSRRVSILAAERLATYAETQRMREETEVKAEGPAAEEEIKAEAEQPVGPLFLGTIGWAIAWVIVGVIVGATVGAIGWAIVGTIGGLIAGLTLRRTASSIKWKQVVAVATGWAIVWAIGGATIGATDSDIGWVVAGTITGAIGASGTLFWARPLLKPLRQAQVWTYSHLVGLLKILRQAPVWTCGRLAAIILLVFGFFGPWTRCSGPSANGESPHYITVTGTGALLFFFPMTMPILLLLIVTFLRLGPQHVRDNGKIIWLERIGAVASLVGIGFVLEKTNEILWGLWTTATGAVLALLNLIGELIANRKRRR